MSTSRQTVPASKIAVAAAAAAALATGLTISCISSAEAAAQCNPTDLNGGGYVCIDYDPSGYRASYSYGTGFKDWMDFNLVCDNGRRFGDNGAFRTYFGAGSNSYVFAVGSQGRCHVVIYDRSDGGETPSPSVIR